MSFASIDDLRSQLGATRTPAQQDAYAAKMLHTVPDAPVVDREGFIRDLCQGKRVLEFGASGSLSQEIRTLASAYQGVDRTAGEQVIGFDLDDVTQTMLPAFEADVIVCGEVLEHLSNPGWFLTRLKRQYPGVTVAITVPNAFSDVARKHLLSSGMENVNRDHVCWYSYRTLMTLLGRAGYVGLSFGWYRGAPRTAEGLVVVVE